MKNFFFEFWPNSFENVLVGADFDDKITPGRSFELGNKQNRHK